MTSKCRQAPTIAVSATASSRSRRTSGKTKPRFEEKGANATLESKFLSPAEAGKIKINENTEPEYTYRDPVPLKWRIFEAAAETNGQRAFGEYWSSLKDFMQGRLSSSELDEAVSRSLGDENVHLHNELILCLLNNTHCRYVPTSLLPVIPASYLAKVAYAYGPEEAPPRSKPQRPPERRERVKVEVNGTTRLPTQTEDSAPSPRLTGNKTEAPQHDGASGSATARHVASSDGYGSSQKMYSNGGRSNGKGLGVKSLPRTAPTIKDEHGSSRIEKRSPAEPGAIRNNATAVYPPAVPEIKPECRPVPAKPKPEMDNGNLLQALTKPARAPVPAPASELPGSSEDDVRKRGDEAEEDDDSRIMEEVDRHFGPHSDLLNLWESEPVAGVEPGPGLRVGVLDSVTGWESEQKSRRKRANPGGFTTVAAPNEILRVDATKAVLARCFDSTDSMGQQAGLGGIGASTGVARSNPIPGACTLAPYMQAVTASQDMKMANDVPRAMTAGVKEYLRRVIGACVVNASDEQGASPSGLGAAGEHIAREAAGGIGRPNPQCQPQSFSPARRGNMGMVGYSNLTELQRRHLMPASGTFPSQRNVLANGRIYQTGAERVSYNRVAGGTPGRYHSLEQVSPHSAKPATLDAFLEDTIGSTNILGAKRVLTPEHLRGALDATPSLAGPPDFARAQRRRLA